MLMAETLLAVPAHQVALLQYLVALLTAELAVQQAQVVQAETHQVDLVARLTAEQVLVETPTVLLQTTTRTQFKQITSNPRNSEKKSPLFSFFLYAPTSLIYLL